MRCNATARLFLYFPPPFSFCLLDYMLCFLFDQWKYMICELWFCSLTQCISSVYCTASDAICFSFVSDLASLCHSPPVFKQGPQRWSFSFFHLEIIFKEPGEPDHMACQIINRFPVLQRASITDLVIVFFFFFSEVTCFNNFEREGGCEVTTQHTPLLPWADFFWVVSLIKCRREDSLLQHASAVMPDGTGVGLCN